MVALSRPVLTDFSFCGTASCIDKPTFVTQTFSSLVFFIHYLYHSVVLNDFEIHLFTARTTEGLICYYRRFKHSLMLQKEKPCNKKTFEQIVDVYIFLVLPKYQIFSFSTARLLMHGGFSFWSIRELLNLL